MKLMKGFISRYGIRILAAAGFIAVVALITYYEYGRIHQNDTQIKSQYTFGIRIDKDLNVIDDAGGSDVQQGAVAAKESDDWIDSLSLLDVSRIWMTAYLNQMQGRFVPSVKAVKNASVNDINVINSNDNTVIIGFTAEAYNKESDYFDSWKGYISNGRMICEWVVRLNIEDMYDGTARISAASVQMPEEYGIKTYVTDQAALQQSTKDSSNLYRYQLVDDKVQVTFDGGEKWTTVPAESAYLLHSYSNKDDSSEASKKAVDEGIYVIDSQNAAFLYGGVAIGGKSVPLTVIFTKDKGEHWTSSQVAELTDVSFAYINMLSDNDGVIVAGYSKSQNMQGSQIYKTTDGGENWRLVGTTPIAKAIVGAKFISTSTGFITYKYDSDMATTLYATFDGGGTFSAVMLEEQQLSDNVGGTYQWNRVFVQANTPVQDSSGKLSLLVTQAAGSTYNNPTLAARYVSDDGGVTWKYIEQIDTKTSK